jgi:hypothetical protein
MLSIMMLRAFFELESPEYRRPTAGVIRLGKK